MNPNIENANTEKAELSYIVYWEAQIWWTSSAQKVCIQIYSNKFRNLHCLNLYIAYKNQPEDVCNYCIPSMGQLGLSGVELGLS